MTRKRIIKWTCFAASLLVSAALLEFGCFVMWRSFPDRFKNGKRIVEVYAYLDRTIPVSMEPHPYMRYQLSSNYTSKGFLQHNSHRYRNPEFSFEKAENTLRILALGGSTTYMFPYITNPQHAWPLRLETRLAGYLESPVQVVNAGLSYATSAGLLASYVFRHQYLDADVIVIHTGGNDIAPLLFEGYNPEYTHFRAQGAGLVPRNMERNILKRSHFARVLYFSVA